MTMTLTEELCDTHLYSQKETAKWLETGLVGVKKMIASQTIKAELRGATLRIPGAEIRRVRIAMDAGGAK